MSWHVFEEKKGTVKSLKYLQFIDKDGQRYHLGKVEDANSWLTAFIFWNQQLRSEFEEQQLKVLNTLLKNYQLILSLMI